MYMYRLYIHVHVHVHVCTTHTCRMSCLNGVPPVAVVVSEVHCIICTLYMYVYVYVIVYTLCTAHECCLPTAEGGRGSQCLWYIPDLQDGLNLVKTLDPYDDTAVKISPCEPSG